MDINDKRVKEQYVMFEELKVGDVYEDKEGFVCIKTHEDDISHNCICFVGDEWEANLESLNVRVIPLQTCLEIEK